MSMGAGIIGLSERARGTQQQAAQPVKMPDGTCVRVLVPLSAQEFFCDTAVNISPGVIQPVGGVYSEVRIDGKVTAIKKHHDVAIVGTGVVMEHVATPSWWEKRNEGVV